MKRKGLFWLKMIFWMNWAAVRDPERMRRLTDELRTGCQLYLHGFASITTADRHHPAMDHLRPYLGGRDLLRVQMPTSEEIKLFVVPLEPDADLEQRPVRLAWFQKKCVANLWIQ